ncbi:MAG: sulfotransferase domain-containing protein, partial [Acidobacteriota bacterium]|nr:sulfotransferase domain-containing protein [Acidobacteriota bacterium]
HRSLALHPSVFLPDQKEIDLFGTAASFARASRILDRHYRKAEDEPARGLSYVGMMFLEGAAERVHEYSSQMKIVAALRNPIDRAYSAYWHHRRTGWEQSETFEEALRREDESDVPDDQAARAMTYRRNGCYADQLEPYIRLFGREQVSLLLSDDLRDRPRETLDRLTDWLGIDPIPEERWSTRRHNEAAMPRYPALQKTLLAHDSRLKRIYQRLVPERIREPIRRTITTPLVLRHEQPFVYPPLAAETRRLLCRYYAPHNARLATIVGRDLGHWV